MGELGEEEGGEGRTEEVDDATDVAAGDEDLPGWEMLGIVEEVVIDTDGGGGGEGLSAMLR